MAKAQITKIRRSQSAASPSAASNGGPTTPPLDVTTRPRRPGKKRKQKPAPSFAGMDYDQISVSAKTNRPPQSWFEEDVNGLR